jgi:hypothetical protein
VVGNRIVAEVLETKIAPISRRRAQAHPRTMAEAAVPIRRLRVRTLRRVAATRLQRGPIQHRAAATQLLRRLRVPTPHQAVLTPHLAAAMAAEAAAALTEAVVAEVHMVAEVEAEVAHTAVEEAHMEVGLTAAKFHCR